MTNKQIASSGRVIILKSNSNRSLYKHQQEAIKALKGISSYDKYKGMLVIPTGGGKTFTSVYWVMNEMINKNKKVLWLAHRHELLNQTIDTVIKKASFKNIVPDRESFTYRVISGMDDHDRPVNIESTDDFIIASKDSLNRGKDYLEKWVKANKDNICIIIDEAHHAVARTYRNIIDLVEEYSENWIRVLGLTATPTRTSENEKGLLRKVFPDDICYSVDLETLIAEGILAKTILHDAHTNVGIRGEISTKDLEYIRRTGNLPEKIAKEITESAERNNLIVSEYIKNKHIYGKTLVFAININHAIALNAIFNDRGIKSDFVVSSLKDAFTGATISSEENSEKIRRFREGVLEVLINVNILTEGTDIPNVQTVFLTRQTTSSILLNQMIGRGLRGVKAGGTKEAYIVSFIDDWKYKINWISPKELVLVDGIYPTSDYKRNSYEQHLINIKIIEDFAIYKDKTIKNKDKNIKYSKYRVLGAYIFDNIYENNGEDEEVTCQVLVFEHLKYAYEELFDNIVDVFKEFNYDTDDTYEDINNLIPEIKDNFFKGYDLSIGYKDEDIKELLYYYATTGQVPRFTEIEVDDNESEGETEIISESPVVIAPPRDYEKMTMGQLRNIAPEFWRKLRDEVFDKFMDEEGYYVSATGLYKSVSRRYFQIDHIVPMADGGRTTLDNLQLLTRWENGIKGTQTQEEFMRKIKENGYSYSEEINNIEDLEEILLNAFDHDETLDNAKALAKKILSEDRENIVALNIQGRLACMEGKYRSALINANKVLAKDRSSTYALYTKGCAYFEKENYQEAIKNFELGVKLEPNFYGYVYLGDCYFELKKKDIALGYYSKAIDFKHENNSVADEVDLVGIYYNMGQIYFSKRKYDAALNYYTEAFKLDSQYDSAINNAGVCLERMGRLNEALENFKRALKIDGSVEVYKSNINKIKKKING